MKRTFQKKHLILLIAFAIVFSLARLSSGASINNGDILVVNHDPSVLGRAVIIKVNPSTGIQEIISVGGLFQNPTDCIILPDNNLLVSDSSAHGLIRVDPTNGEQTFLSVGGLFANPEGLAVGLNGYVFVADCCGLSPNVIIRVDPLNGNQELFATGGYLKSPFKIKIGGSSELLVVDPDAFGGEVAAL